MKRNVLGLMATAALVPAAWLVSNAAGPEPEDGQAEPQPDGQGAQAGLPEPGFAMMNDLSSDHATAEQSAESGFAALAVPAADVQPLPRKEAAPEAALVTTDAVATRRVSPRSSGRKVQRHPIPAADHAVVSEPAQVRVAMAEPVTSHLPSVDAEPAPRPLTRLEEVSLKQSVTAPLIRDDVMASAANSGPLIAAAVDNAVPRGAAEETALPAAVDASAPPIAEPEIAPAENPPPVDTGTAAIADPVPEPPSVTPVAQQSASPLPVAAHAAALAFSPPQSTAANTIALDAPVINAASLPTPAFGQEKSGLTAASYSPEPEPAVQSLPAEPPAPVGPPDPAGTARPGQVATLADAIAYSYSSNPRLLAERASLRSADYGYPAARAAYGPRLDAVGNLTFTRDNEEYIPGSYDRRQGWTDTASLVLSQPILTFGRNKALEKQALANIEYRREALRLTQDDVLLSVIGAYVGVLREAGAVTIARENVALLEKELADSRARFAVREITAADVGQVEARLSLGRTILLTAQGDLAQQQARFYEAVGMPPGELAPPDEVTLPAQTLAEAYAVGDASSPLVAAARAREKVSRSVLAGARAEQMPSLGFRGTADYGSVSDYNTELRATRLRGQFTLSVPLIDSGGRSAEIGRAEEANAADWRLFEAASREARSEIAANWNRLLAARKSLDHFRQAVRSSEQVYQGAQLQERAGMRTTLELLDLARDLLDVRNRYNDALANEYLARASLVAAMGRLDPQDFSPGLALYDPAVHFRRTRRQGDVPLLTGALSSLDGILVGDLDRPRPNRDPASLGGTGAFLPDQ